MTQQTSNRWMKSVMTDVTRSFLLLIGAFFGVLFLLEFSQLLANFWVLLWFHVTFFEVCGGLEKVFYIFWYWCGKLVAFFLLSNRFFAAGFFI